MTTVARKHTVFSLEQAVGAAPNLAALQERIQTSRACLELVKPLIPAMLHKQIQPGPIGDGEWCLLVGSASASTKLRQLLPAFQKRLTESGAQINSIRLKIQHPLR